MRNPNVLKHTLPEPERPKSLAKSAQWLAGEGAGSWFYIEVTSNDTKFLVQRFSPEGQLECTGIFECKNSKYALHLDQPYQFVHLSHCAVVHIEQGSEVFKLVR